MAISIRFMRKQYILFFRRYLLPDLRQNNMPAKANKCTWKHMSLYQVAKDHVYALSWGSKDQFSNSTVQQCVCNHSRQPAADGSVGLCHPSQPSRSSLPSSCKPPPCSAVVPIRALSWTPGGTHLPGAGAAKLGLGEESLHWPAGVPVTALPYHHASSLLHVSTIPCRNACFWSSCPWASGPAACAYASHACSRDAAPAADGLPTECSLLTISFCKATVPTHQVCQTGKEKERKKEVKRS